MDAEVQEFLARHASLKDGNTRQRVVERIFAGTDDPDSLVARWRSSWRVIAETEASLSHQFSRQE